MQMHDFVIECVVGLGFSGLLFVSRGFVSGDMGFKQIGYMARHHAFLTMIL